MGKSRLLLELRAALERTHRSLTWRQGRCLPYGEGITFWALGEIVKAEAGILESDPATVVQAKLAAVIPHGTDSTWIHERLLPLVGVESGQTSREESFAAWRAFLEGLAAKGPAIVVIEDLHWADDALLAFLEEAARESTRGPLLLLATARPEFLGTHPDFAADLPNAHMLRLAPLSTGRHDRSGRVVARQRGATGIDRPHRGAGGWQPSVRRGVCGIAPRSRPPGGSRWRGQAPPRRRPSGPDLHSWSAGRPPGHPAG